MIINEVHDFYKDQKFYTGLKKYPAEVKKIIIDFFRKKGVDKFAENSYLDDMMSYSESSKKSDKERENDFKRMFNAFDIGADFFSAESSYRSELRIPRIIYDDYMILIKLKSNEDFIDEGHDLNINIKGIDDESRNTKEYKYKIDLMRRISEVLDDIWKNVQTSIKKYKSHDESDEKRLPHRSYKKSDVERIVDKYLQQTFKTTELKTKTKKTKIDDFDKLPIEFSVSMDRPNNSKVSTYERKGGKTGFSINFKVKKTKRFTYTFMKEDPKVGKWIDVLEQAKDNRQFKKFLIRLAENNTLITDIHDKMINQLHFASLKFAKMGYIPTRTSTPWNSKEPGKIYFEYNEKMHSKAKQKFPEVKKYIDNFFYKEIERKVFSKNLRMNDIPRLFINEVFR